MFHGSFGVLHVAVSLHFVEKIGVEDAVKTRVEFVDSGMSAESQLAFRHETAHAASVERGVITHHWFACLPGAVEGRVAGDALYVVLQEECIHVVRPLWLSLDVWVCVFEVAVC